jgi:hypothetical protein
MAHMVEEVHERMYGTKFGTHAEEVCGRILSTQVEEVREGLFLLYYRKSTRNHEILKTKVCKKIEGRRDQRCKRNHRK